MKPIIFQGTATLPKFNKKSQSQPVGRRNLSTDNISARIGMGADGIPIGEACRSDPCVQSAHRSDYTEIPHGRQCCQDRFVLSHVACRGSNGDKIRKVSKDCHKCRDFRQLRSVLALAATNKTVDVKQKILDINVPDININVRDINIHVRRHQHQCSGHQHPCAPTSTSMFRTSTSMSGTQTSRSKTLSSMVKPSLSMSRALSFRIKSLRP